MTVSGDLTGHRLDFAVSRELGISRAYAQSLIKNGRVASLDGHRIRGIKPSVRVEDGERYIIDVPEPEKLDLEPEDVPFGVVYSDRDIIVIDKPAGLVVHPAPGHWRGTLVHGLLFRFPEMGNLNGVERPGIVHRLDATTSGLMVAARSGLAQEKLWNAFKSRAVDKTYIALCHGTPRAARARIDMPIARDPSDGKRMAVRDGGRPSVTEYETLWSAAGQAEHIKYSLISCVLRTGRTHQIRVHLNAIGCPLVGDTLYAPSRENPFDGPRVFLHSWKLSFQHPRSGEKISFRSFIPEDLREILVKLNK